MKHLDGFGSFTSVDRIALLAPLRRDALPNLPDLPNLLGPPIARVCAGARLRVWSYQKGSARFGTSSHVVILTVVRVPNLVGFRGSAEVRQRGARFGTFPLEHHVRRKPMPEQSRGLLPGDYRLLFSSRCMFVAGVARREEQG